MIELVAVSKEYQVGNDTVHALRDVSLALQSGEVTAIVGPSGCGKSTLLHTVGQLTQPTRGFVKIDGAVVSHRSDGAAARYRNENFGYLLQDFALVETDTVFDNVRIPLIYSRKRTTHQRERVAEALAIFDIADLIDFPVGKLSGGQRQRIAMARAVINGPRFILADEPTGSLDSENGERVFDYLQQLASRGSTVVMVTHDLDLAARCDTIHTLRDGAVVKPVSASTVRQGIEK